MFFSSLKVNVTASVEFELVYSGVEVQHVSHDVSIEFNFTFVDCEVTLLFHFFSYFVL